MSIRDYDSKSRKITPGASCRYISICKSTEIMSRNRKHAEPKKGIRENTLEIYREKGILAAYVALQAHNKKIGSEVYTRETLEQWIAEDAQKRGYKKDDGFDR